MIIGDDIATPPAGDDRDAKELGEPEQLGRGPRPEDAGTGEDHRTAGGRHQLDRGAQLLGLGPARSGSRRIVRGSGGDDLVDQILRNREERWSWPRSDCGANGVADGSRKILDGRELDGVPGEAADRRRLVDLLECLATEERPIDLTNEDEHRGGVLACRVDPDREVRRSDGPRPQGDRRAAGQLPVGLGHECSRTLVAGRDDPDPCPIETLEKTEEALAGHREGISHPGGAKRIGDEPADRARAGRRRADRFLIADHGFLA